MRVRFYEKVQNAQKELGANQMNYDGSLENGSETLGTIGFVALFYLVR